MIKQRYIPFPRYENAIFIGDSATEAVAALKIFAKALVGGDVPSFELYHPQEKMLECTACAMRDRKQVVEAAARKLGVDYILLEDNGLADLNPALMANALTHAGFAVKVLDVTGDVFTTLRKAGELFHEERQAERVIEEFQEREAELSSKSKPNSKNVLALLAIKHPVSLEDYIFALNDRSELMLDIVAEFRSRSALVGGNEVMPGLVTIENLQQLLLKTNPDIITVCGDAQAGIQKLICLFQSDDMVRNLPVFKAFNIVPAPYFCRALGWRRAAIAERWYELLSL